MGLQFRYQRAKMYREVALGLKHHMSISQGMPAHTHTCINLLVVIIVLCSLPRPNIPNKEGKLAIRNLLFALVVVYVSYNIIPALMQQVYIHYEKIRPDLPDCCDVEGRKLIQN